MIPNLGHVQSCPVVQLDKQGAWIQLPTDRSSRTTLKVVALLPAPEVPPDARVGQVLEVFIFLDRNDQPIATLKRPAIELGEVAFLEVVDLTPFGAFAGWGIPKDLLVPFKEQTEPMKVGSRYPIGLYVDDRGRLAGTARVRDILQSGGTFVQGDWVDGVAWRQEDTVGLFVIIARKYLALLPESEPHTLSPGQAARFRVAYVHPDGRIEVSCRQLAYQEIPGDAQRILTAVRDPKMPRVGDHSDPMLIRSLFGMSKKSFKRACGNLLKQNLVCFDEAGNLQVGPGRSDSGKVTPSGEKAGRHADDNRRQGVPGRSTARAARPPAKSSSGPSSGRAQPRQTFRRKT